MKKKLPEVGTDNQTRASTIKQTKFQFRLYPPLEIEFQSLSLRGKTANDEIPPLSSMDFTAVE